MPNYLLPVFMLTWAIGSSGMAQPPLPGAPVEAKQSPVPRAISKADLEKPKADSCTPEILEIAKTKQRAEYRECKSSYDYWCTEVARLSAKADPNKSHLLSRAQGKARELSEQAKEITSQAHIDKLVQDEVAIKAGLDGLREARVNSLKKDMANKEAERQRLAAAATAERQAAYERAERARRQQLEQEARDRETWGVLSEEKYGRIEAGMSISQVEKIVGPGKNLGSRMLKVGQFKFEVTEYRWVCTAGTGILDISFDEDGLYKKEVEWN